MKRKSRFPLPGQRILRSAIAVAACLVIYMLRGAKGYPLYSALAAMQCIQPYTKDMKGVARKRVFGTVIGASLGLLELLLEISLISHGIPERSQHFIIVPLFLIVVLYSTVLLKVPEMAYFSGVVYLSITINHFADANPYLFAANRLLDTVIGVAVASVINRIHLPRGRNTDTLYVSALGHSLLGSDSRLTPYSKVELNRLVEDGMKFTLSTVETQATVRELLPGVKLKYPVIVMDGAALYDMNTLEYKKTFPLPETKAKRVMTWLNECGYPFFCYTISQNLLVIRYKELSNDGMRQVYESRRLSPYRNYYQSPEDVSENVVYLMVLDTHENIQKAHDALTAEPWASEYRIKVRVSRFEGYSNMRIFDASCSREAMLRELEAEMGTKETVTFGGVADRYDVYIENADRNLLVKELKKRFEPVDFRQWKRIFRL